MITQKEYLRHQGMICPYCRSAHISADMVPVVDGTVAEQEIECLDCNKTWRDRYRLTGFEIQPKESHEVSGEPGSPQVVPSAVRGVRAAEPVAVTSGRT